MTDAVSLKPDLGRFGVWLGARSITPELAAQDRVARLWRRLDRRIAGRRSGLGRAGLGATSSLQLATGIVNIWSAPATRRRRVLQRIESAYPGRFLLGIGVGHPEHTQEYLKPYDALVEYLDALDAAWCRPAAGCSPRSGPRCCSWPPNAAPAPTRI